MGKLEKSMGKKPLNLPNTSKTNTQPNNTPPFISGEWVEFYMEMIQEWECISVNYLLFSLFMHSSLDIDFGSCQRQYAVLNNFLIFDVTYNCPKPVMLWVTLTYSSLRSNPPAVGSSLRCYLVFVSSKNFPKNFRGTFKFSSLNPVVLQTKQFCTFLATLDYLWVTGWDCRLWKGSNA